MTSDVDSALKVFIAAELSRSIDPDVGALADLVRARFGDAVCAVLYYGSCLRTGDLDDKVLDFYVIVKDYRRAYTGWAMAAANRILPPNVFYIEADIGADFGAGADAKTGGRELRAKYAVLSLDDFIRRCDQRTLNVTVWARFSQPSALVWSDSEGTRNAVTGAVTQAVQSMVSVALPFVSNGADNADNIGASEIWQTAFALTYGAELRSEKGGKEKELFALDQDRYTAITPFVLESLSDVVALKGNRRRAVWRWRLRRANGKTVSLLRLIKGAFTFDGGIDYLAWKISRHSGVKLEVKPWQRRHPIVAGLLLFLSLRRRGAFR